MVDAAGTELVVLLTAGIALVLLLVALSVMVLAVTLDNVLGGRDCEGEFEQSTVLDFPVTT